MRVASLTLGLFFVGSAIAAPKDLPNVQAPRELTEVGSEYAEGTITRLSAEDISVFIPFAQNAKSVLTKALADAATMPVRQQVTHLSNTMRAVVRNSGQRQYQTFMRFALNRTLLLVEELRKEADFSVPGTLENALDLQVRGISVALRFFESDLAYQRRERSGGDSVNIKHAAFGAAFAASSLRSIQNVYDASAQYRLLYKTLEMFNWDVTRDRHAVEVADTIVDIYNTLSSLQETPAADDQENILSIRRLSLLITPVTNVESIIAQAESRAEEAVRRQQQEAQREAERLRRRQQFPFSVGQTVIDLTDFNNPRTATIHELRGEVVILRIPGNRFETVSIDNLARTSGCLGEHCVGNTVINVERDNVYVKVVAIAQDETMVIEFREGTELRGKLGAGWITDSLARTKGCTDNICVGDTVYVMEGDFRARVIGIQSIGSFVIQVLDGDQKDARGENWTSEQVTKID